MAGTGQSNDKLRRERRRRGWSQRDVADRMGEAARAKGLSEPRVDPDYVSKWERGIKQPDPYHVYLLCLAFELPSDRLGLPGDSDAPGEERRRPHAPIEVPSPGTPELLAGLAGALLPGPGEPWERLDYALKHPAAIDTGTIAHLEQVLVVLETVERHVEATALFGAVTGHLAAITNLLRGSMPLNARRQLCSIAGETAGLAGRLFAQLTRERTAEAYFRSGLTAAREADDQALIAYLLGMMAGQAMYRDNPTARLAVLRSAPASRATLITRVFLAAKEADAHAIAGDASAALDALGQAETAMASKPDRSSAYRPRAPWWPAETWLTGERGATLARLGRMDEADRHLTAALSAPTNAKHRLWLMIALARVRTGQREPEEAARLVSNVERQAAPLHMTTVLHEIGSVRRELSPWNASPAVQSLDDAPATSSSEADA
jgi:transcriptional regulator with XRE-family HTH domain